MEYVIVTYPTERDVLIDDQISGKTDAKLSVQRGHHLFSLDGDKDFTPEEQEINVRNTTSHDPMIVAFDPRSDDAPAPADSDIA